MTRGERAAIGFILANSATAALLSNHPEGVADIVFHALSWIVQYALAMWLFLTAFVGKESEQPKAGAKLSKRAR